MIDLFTSFIFQHKANTFTGVEYGRSNAPLGNITFKAKKLGSKYNNYSITVAALGANSYMLFIKDPSGNNVFVPKRVSGVTNATEFASKINSTEFRDFLCFVYVNVAGPIPVGSTVLVGGVDYINFKNIRFTYSAISDGGLFIFDNSVENLVVTQIEGAFDTVPTLTEVYVNLVSLDESLSVIPDEQSIFYCTKLDATHKSFVLTDCKIQVAPFRAIKVTFPYSGSIRLTARRESTVPYNN